MEQRGLTTRYADLGGARVGFASVGEGPPLVLLPAGSSQVDLLYEHEQWRGFIERLAGFTRVIIFDHRGQGVSDPFTAGEDWFDGSARDILAVMDAAGVESADLLAYDSGGARALNLAATHPQRVRRLVLVNTCARYMSAPDYPHGPPPTWLDLALEFTADHWGSGRVMMQFDRDHPELAEFWARYERSAGSPERQQQFFRRDVLLDARSLVPDVRQPSLVLHASEDPNIDPNHSRWLAEHLPDSRRVEYPGSGHLDWFHLHADFVLGEVEEFLTGTRRDRAPERALATVLFTDIVASTERAVEMGDAAWRSMLDRHDSLAGELVARHRGRLVKRTGDGLLATFGVPTDGIGCALALGRALSTMGIDVRAGLHVGEIELRGDDVSGVAVHIASRVQGLAGSNELLVTRTVKDVVAGSSHHFTDRGVHELKGIRDGWQLYAVAAAS